MKAKRKDGFSPLGLGVAACVACCAGPILAFLGGIGIAGIASTWLIGGAGLLITAVAVIAFIAVRRRQERSTCATDPSVPTPVELTARRMTR